MAKIARLRAIELVLGILALSLRVQNASAEPKVLCYYDGEAAIRKDALAGKVTLDDIGAALPFCTHLLYGYAGIDPNTHRIRALNEDLDLDSGKGHFRLATELKNKFPGLKVFLSIGAYYDLNEENHSLKYLSLLESDATRATFIESARTLLKTYKFDGLDLAWQLPQSNPKPFTDSIVDENAAEHREGLTSLVRDMKKAFEEDDLGLGYTQTSHVNESIFLDIASLKDIVEYVSINAFDQQIPQRNPDEADYLTPLYEPPGRVKGNNVDAKVKAWSSAGTPLDKIIVGIPTYARGWKLVKESDPSGRPPIRADGASSVRSHSTYTGYYSYGEVCGMLSNSSAGNLSPLRTVNDDSTKRFGPYAFRLPDENGEQGIWLTYEDPESAGNKAAYVKEHGLGGIAVNDLVDDDFSGTCTGDKFPITRAVKHRLAG
ncbi:chitinase-like protein Idgf4 [Anopheles bellator]|uniref:chitinase-like protein Idgf4 n=1 Tax=Anopheles bellator TaxID=139047 RepID=UPI00264875D0|nr:chitinase-like protein Idgf4 [Anopheles bellator]